MSERDEQAETALCAKLAELLPFYLNGSLEAAEARRVEDHLTSCAACRQEERDTRTAWALFEGHLPVELLLDHAMGQPMSSTRREVVESHLAVCERCAAEVTTVRQDAHDSDHGVSETAVRERRRAADPPKGRIASFQDRVAPASSRRDSGSLRTLAWAASFIAVVASSGWVWTWLQLTDIRAVSALTARANLPVVELLPATQTLLRQGGVDPLSAVNRVELLPRPGEVVLVLLSGGRFCELACSLEIYAAGGGQPKHRMEGLMASSDGHVTLALPDDWLPSGRALLVVRDQVGESVAEYLIEIQSSDVSAD